ncbi:MAG TPA: hypothetical protein PL070_09920, partial [Flavobacteriales bacterium]|nr:hypothetical protein [Flavobacteriales bacterium]
MNKLHVLWSVMLLWGIAPRHGHAQSALQLTGESSGSNVVVEGRSEDPDDPDPLFQAVWRSVPGASAQFQIQRTAEPDANTRLMLDRLLEAGIGAYLDSR